MSRAFFIGLLCLGLLACRGDTGLQRMSDYELAQKHKECVKRKPTAPGAMLACDNIRRECERRHKSLGNYICAG